MMAFSFLILEKESAFIRKFKNIIESVNPSGKVYSTSDVEEAFRLVKEVNVDVFLIDVTTKDQLTELTGLDFIKEIRKEIHRLTPIIVVSSILDPQQMIETFHESKVLAYIDKRFDAEQITPEFEKALEIAKVSNNRMISFKKKHDLIVFPTRNLISIQRMPNGKKKVLVTSFDDLTQEVVAEEFSIKSSLGEILNAIENDNDLIRVHQSWLINPKMIRGLSFLREELTLYSNIKVPIGTTYKERLAPFL